MLFFACCNGDCMNGVAVVVVNDEYIIVARYGGTDKTAGLTGKGMTCNFDVVDKNVVCTGVN